MEAAIQNLFRIFSSPLREKTMNGHTPSPFQPFPLHFPPSQHPLQPDFKPERSPKIIGLKILDCLIIYLVQFKAHISPVSLIWTRRDDHPDKIHACTPP